MCACERGSGRAGTLGCTRLGKRSVRRRFVGAQARGLGEAARPRSLLRIIRGGDGDRWERAARPSDWAGVGWGSVSPREEPEAGSGTEDEERWGGALQRPYPERWVGAPKEAIASDGREGRIRIMAETLECEWD